MPAPVTIRACQPGDLPSVFGLLAQLSGFAHGYSGPDLARVRALFTEMEAAPAVYFNLVAEQDGRVAGFVSVCFYKTLFHTGGTALINELVVERAYRNAGIGKALIDSVIAEARQRGMDEVEVGTEKDNLAAQRFYRRCGFDEEYVLLGLEF